MLQIDVNDRSAIAPVTTHASRDHIFVVGPYNKWSIINCVELELEREGTRLQHKYHVTNDPSKSTRFIDVEEKKW